MLNATVLFDNLFRSVKITPERLYAFGIVVLQALINGNDSGQFDSIIATLTAALNVLGTEISEMDTNLTEQKTETKGIKDFIVAFYNFMGTNEPFIARQLGGKDSAGYKAFYPFGQSEYSGATQTTMPMLTSRVGKAAKKYAESLDADLVSQLESFNPDFVKQYGSLQAQKHIVKQERDQRGAAVLQTQLALSAAVYTVGVQYPGNVAKCGSFFPFAMLYPQTKRTTETVEGQLATNATVNLLNRTLTKSVTITATNTGDNAPFAIWAAPNATDAMPEDAFIVNAAAPPVTIEASELGNLQKNTFIMIKNLSDINTCQYEVSFTGLKKVIEQTAATDKLKVVGE